MTTAERIAKLDRRDAQRAERAARRIAWTAHKRARREEERRRRRRKLDHASDILPPAYRPPTVLA